MKFSDITQAQKDAGELVALFDGDGETAEVGLYLESQGLEPIEVNVPPDWPAYLTPNFLKSQCCRLCQT